jgi:hypothetical protein
MHVQRRTSEQQEQADSKRADSHATDAKREHVSSGSKLTAKGQTHNLCRCKKEDQ